MIDKILLLVAGMILGGFITVKFEEYYFIKKYANIKLSEEEYKEIRRKISFIESFVSVFVAAVVYLTIQHYFIYGICLGAFIFSRK